MTAPTPADVPGRGEVEGLARALAQVTADNEINCTGLGEVGCRGRHGWHSWTDHRRHIAESQVAAILASDWLAERDAEVARAAKAEAWDEGHARAHGYDLSYYLDREEWSEEYADAPNPYRATEPRA